MKKFLSILTSGSFSLFAKLMAEMFMSINYVYTIIRHAMLNEQLVSALSETKFQISKKPKEDPLVKFGTEGSALWV